MIANKTTIDQRTNDAAVSILDLPVLQHCSKQDSREFSLRQDNSSARGLVNENILSTKGASKCVSGPQWVMD